MRRRPVVAFVVLAYALTWGWCLPLVLRGEVARPGVGWPTHVPGLLGPAVAALVVTAVVDGVAGLRELATRMVRWRIGWVWWAIVAGTLALMLLGVVVPLLTGGDLPSLRDFTRYSGVASWSPLAVVLVAFVANGFGEETGWRGFAVERLLRTHSLTWTAGVVGLVWIGWHLPYFWCVQSFRHFGVLAVGWAVGLMAGSVALTWLYREGHHSVLLVAAWHTAFNLTSATKATGAVIGVATTAVVITWAVWVLRREHAHDRAPATMDR